MNNTSSQTKLKAIVEKMVERGWRPEKEGEEYYSFKLYYVDKEKVIFYIIEEEGHETPDSTDFWVYTFPDLLCTPAAMGALFGEEWVCGVCGWNELTVVSTSLWCSSCMRYMNKGSEAPARLYHTLEAVKRIFSESAGLETAIAYLYREMMK